MDETGRISRDEVVQSLHEIAQRGVLHPDELDPSDPDVARAHELLFLYTQQENDRVKRLGTMAALCLSIFEETTLEVDAGFTHPQYVEEVANDWLVQDEETALSYGLFELADKIRRKRDELNKHLIEN